MAEASETELIAYVKANGRICPMPDPWNALFNLLPNRRQLASGGWMPPLPLILAAWWLATPSSKRRCLEEHIRWAVDHGALAEIDAYLRGIPESDWFHEGE
ncbi:hypothetical protein [Paramagnetospirillum magneticum]|uniref:hypothetical protein n=1 Tax=Paramagnetospirillum magneticum TaxID=84159 RepID=UPI0011D0BDF3|nr:hypothetical protein [Paramagnetospirillum magneticum]